MYNVVEQIAQTGENIMKNKTGPAYKYPHDGALSDRITIRVTPQQKEYIMKKAGTSDLREILLDYVKAYNVGQLPLEYSKTGVADVLEDR